MCRPETSGVRAIAAALALGALLAGCSDPGLYLDRRDTIALSGGNAVAANAAEEMVNPWPPVSENTHIAANGQKMQSAVERYRTDRVTQPGDPTSLQVASQPPAMVLTGSPSGAPGGNAAPAQ